MKQKLIFILILLLGLALRFYALNDFPTGFQRDEAFLGFNAFSLLKTGREMTGDFLPLHLRSFLFTPAGYSYLSAIPIFLFDLSKFSVRFPSAFFGFLTIPLVYLLAREMFEKEKLNKANVFGLFVAFILAISPWHINLSRTASVITPVVFLILLGIYFYFKSLKKTKILFLILSFVSFFLSLFFYVSPYSFLPLLAPGLFLFFPHKNKKTFIVLYLLLIIIPLFLTISSKNLSTRVNSISIIKNNETSLRIDESVREDGVAKINTNFVRFFHNKPSVLSTIFFQNYFEHLSYSFFFTDNAFPDRFRIPRMGLMYLFELGLIVLGVYYSLKNNSKSGFFLIFWALVSPVGSSLSFDDVPNMQRTLYMLPPLLLLEGIGLFYLINKFKVKKILPVLLIVVFLNLSYYTHQYFFHGAVYRPWYRQEGYESLVNKLNNYLPNYKKAVITNRESGPSAEVAFFTKFDPLSFQKDTMNQDVQNSDMVSFGKYIFSNEECPLKTELNNGETASSGEKNFIYVNSGLCKIPEKVKVLETIRRSDNSIVFYILALNN